MKIVRDLQWRIQIWVYTVSIFVFIATSCLSCSSQKNIQKTDTNVGFIGKRWQKDRCDYVFAVYPNKETEPVTSVNVSDDAADDPAIWYHHDDPNLSVVFGSNKKAGIHSYSIEGNELQFIPCGEINNIDIRQDIRVNGSSTDIIAGSNRSDNSIIFYEIDPEGRMKLDMLYQIQLYEFEPYGFCLQRTEAAGLIAYVNNKQGLIHQYVLDFSSDMISHSLGLEIQLPSQLEGMTVDDDKKELFVGEENKGIYHIDLNMADVVPTLIEESLASHSKCIKYDIEGLALLTNKFLVASIQGNNSYAVFNRETNSLVTSFVIKDADGIDGVSETDGIEILNKPLGEQYPDGILVVQDGENRMGNQIGNQNFKIINIQDIMKHLD